MSDKRQKNRRAAAYDSTLDGYQNAPYLERSIPYSAGSLYSTVADNSSGGNSTGWAGTCSNESGLLTQS